MMMYNWKKGLTLAAILFAVMFTGCEESDGRSLFHSGITEQVDLSEIELPEEVNVYRTSYWKVSDEQIFNCFLHGNIIEKESWAEGPRYVTDGEMEAVREVKRRIEELQVIQCTSCRYCTPECPKKIAIPDIFRLLNEEAVLSDKTKPQKDYAAMVAEGRTGRAASCIKCGRCEKTCPQQLPIRALLEKAETVLNFRA